MQRSKLVRKGYQFRAFPLLEMSWSATKTNNYPIMVQIWSHVACERADVFPIVSSLPPKNGGWDATSGAISRGFNLYHPRGSEFVQVAFVNLTAVGGKDILVQLRKAKFVKTTVLISIFTGRDKLFAERGKVFEGFRSLRKRFIVGPAWQNLGGIYHVVIPN